MARQAPSSPVKPRQAAGEPAQSVMYGKRARCILSATLDVHKMTIAVTVADGGRSGESSALGRLRQSRRCAAQDGRAPSRRPDCAGRRGLWCDRYCGVGKSWLSCALAHKACRDGYAVYYARAPRLFADLELAHGDGRFARLFRMLVKVDLLILDDWGPDRLTASQRRDLMEIVEDRHGRGSILITSQLPVPTWHEVIGESTLGDAILDRIVHNAYRLELDGPSMRKIKAAETIARP